MVRASQTNFDRSKPAVALGASASRRNSVSANWSPNFDREVAGVVTGQGVFADDSHVALMRARLDA
jgi:hypothetical protein